VRCRADIGKWFEFGPGTGGWAYVRRYPEKSEGSKPAPVAKGPRIFPASELKAFATERRMTLDDPRRYIESKGHTER